MLKSLNPTISNVYRQISSDGFTQFQYQNSKWQQKFRMILNNSISPNIEVMLYAPSNPVSYLEQPYTTIAPTSAAVKSLLYKPSSYLEQILSNR